MFPVKLVLSQSDIDNICITKSLSLRNSSYSISGIVNLLEGSTVENPMFECSVRRTTTVDGEQWIKFSKEKESKTSLEDVLLLTPYPHLLFYHLNE